MGKTKLFSSLFVLLPEDDHKLMELVKSGNQNAYRRLFEKHKDSIYSFVLYKVKRQDAAEEITQETFMRVYKHAESYRAEHKFTTWIYAIARNLSLDFLKKKKELHFGESSEDEMGIEDFKDEEVDLEAALLHKSNKEILLKCLEGLKDSQKEVLTMRIFSENSYAEIASFLDKTEKSIKSLINRAKESLNLCVQKCLEG